MSPIHNINVLLCRHFQTNLMRLAGRKPTFSTDKESFSIYYQFCVFFLLKIYLINSITLFLLSLIYLTKDLFGLFLTQLSIIVKKKKKKNITEHWKLNIIALGDIFPHNKDAAVYSQ